MTDFDVIVVGAGVIGLATGARLTHRGAKVLVVERHPGPGRETSSRNSEVIHAGIYYPPGSIRARTCVRGNRLLYDFCQRNGIAHQALGKLIVATEESELPELEQLLQRGNQNGARGLRLIDRRELAAMEPNVRGIAALLSPSTGILDSHGLLKTLEAQTRAPGGEVLYRCEVTDIEFLNPGYLVHLRNPSGIETARCRILVNVAGLESDRVAGMAGVDGYRLHRCKGDYFTVAGRPDLRVAHLIYPVPTAHLVGLGIHVTLDLAGQMRLGPDATYVERESTDLDVEPAKAELFHASAQRFLPGLRLDDLQPHMSGMRPKLQGPQDPWQDFLVREESAAGRPGLINLIGIDSPGLTACLALAEEVNSFVLKI